MKAICVAILVVGVSCMPCLTLSQADPTSRIVTRGIARVSLPSDHAIIDISVQAVAASASIAATEHSTLLANVTDALVECGVSSDSVDVAGYAVVPNYEYTSEGRQQQGFRARASVRFRVWDLAALGGLVEAALEAGAHSVDGIRFGASNSEAARDSALGLAVWNALHDAEVLAAAAGETLGALLELTTEIGSLPVPVRTRAQMEQVRSSATVAIDPQDVVVEVVVVGQWLIVPR